MRALAEGPRRIFVVYGKNSAGRPVTHEVEIPPRPGSEWVPDESVAKIVERRSSYVRAECGEGPIDPLAYYRPYTYSRHEWGIYFIERNIRDDFRELVNVIMTSRRANTPIYLVSLLYPNLIILHELCHHTLENVRVMRGEGKTYNLDDEGLCEYTAFALAELAGPIYPVYPVLPLAPVNAGLDVGAFVVRVDVRRRASGGPGSTIFVGSHGQSPSVVTFNAYWPAPQPLHNNRPLPLGYSLLGKWRALSILYYWWGRDSPNSHYRPRVSNKYTEDFLEDYWRQLAADLAPYVDAVMTDKPVPRRESVWWRVFWDDRDPSAIIRELCKGPQDSAFEDWESQGP